MNLIVAVIFIILGILVKNFQLYFLIAGYNTMSKEDQENVDIEGIATLFRNAMFGMAIIMLISYGLSKWLDNANIELFGFFFALILGLPYLLIVSNSSKYKINKEK